MVVWGKGGKVIKIPFAIGAETRYVYLKPFCKLAGGVGMVYCTKKAHETYTNDLGKSPTKEYYYQWCQIMVKWEVPMEGKRCVGLTHGGP